MHGGSEILETVCGDAGAPIPRLLLADSDPIFLCGLASALRADFAIAGEATTWRDHLNLLGGVDVDLMGFTLACGRNALGLLPEIRRQDPQIPVIVLLSPTAACVASHLKAAGCTALISRRTHPHDLPQLVREALQGCSLPPVDNHSPREASTAGSVDLSALSAREMEIFRLIGHRKSTKEIAAILNISGKTVSAHRENIKAKLKLSGSGMLNVVAVSHAVWEVTGADYII